MDLAPRALAAGARVVDVSGAFRLAAADYPRWYGFTHACPELLDEAVYSMPEATGASERGCARRAWCSNPGCYATASTLAVLPLLSAGVIERDGIIIDAKSGTTGAGRKGTEDFSFSEVDGDFRAYRVLRHQHTPGDRARAVAGRRALGAGDVDVAPAADPARDPRDGLRPAASGQDRRRRRGGDEGVRRRAAVPARRQARRRAHAGGGRHQPRAAGRRRRSPSAASRSAFAPSTTWSRGRPDRRCRTPT